MILQVSCGDRCQCVHLLLSGLWVLMEILVVDVEEVAHGPSGVVFAGVLLLYSALLGLGGVSLGRVSLVAGGNTLRLQR